MTEGDQGKKAPLDGFTVMVNAGDHDRHWTPVAVDLEKRLLGTDESAVHAVDEQQIEYPVQIDATGDTRVRLHWIVPRMKAGQTIPFTFTTADDDRRPPTVRHVRRDDRVDIFVRDRLFTTYEHGTRWARPFLYPVIGPAGGNVTRHFPIKKDVKGEKHDHPHHKSIYFTHGDVNGVDNWSEAEGHGYTRHLSFSSLNDGPVYGTLRAENVWTDGEQKPIVDQNLELRVYGLPDHTRMFDATLTFHASHGDVTFGDTKEGGLLSVRVASTMDASGSGRIETGTGAVGERESWGRSAPWCHYSGIVQSDHGPAHTGIGIIDHPSNPRFPTYWHVRNYGLMTANPFGLSHFYKDKTRDGSFHLKAGQTATFRYRVVIHEGDARDGHMDRRFLDFAYPPAVNVITDD